MKGTRRQPLSIDAAITMSFAGMIASVVTRLPLLLTLESIPVTSDANGGARGDHQILVD
jgi:hypothetical protein